MTKVSVHVHLTTRDTPPRQKIRSSSDLLVMMCVLVLQVRLPLRLLWVLPPPVPAVFLSWQCGWQQSQVWCCCLAHLFVHYRQFLRYSAACLAAAARSVSVGKHGGLLE